MHFFVTLFICSVGHKGQWGHEFLEFELRPSGLLRYANNSNYRSEALIRKECYLSPLATSLFRSIVEKCSLTQLDDTDWPRADVRSPLGRQELEIIVGGQHALYITSKLGSVREVAKYSKEIDQANDLETFYYAIQDLKALVLTLMAAHFKLRPI